ncbi:hypothetical protein FKX85_00770 [Echinicola soli]|uniref:Uncharacterized protein n=1 Tax=Echinicola soli TaxID=2591634 RepID=A0A514CCW2_9BACT|nr:hypothetical protein FKX85_00770 [Echinicola soli]
MNIAKGSTRQSNRGCRRLLGSAIRSGGEMVSCLYIGIKRMVIE